VKLPVELELSARKSQVRKAIRYKRRAVRRVGERETRAWNDYTAKQAHRDRAS
jgi:hypothetical protein